MKQKCRRCKEKKELTEFHKDKSRANGYGNLCKKCTKKDAKKYYQVMKLKKYNLARQREKFPDFGRRALRCRRETILLGIPSVFQEV